MSSRYNWICMTHDPAIEVDHPEYQSFNEITGAILNKDKPKEHSECDLIVARWSGGMAEAVCAGCKYHGSAYQKWVDLDWLRLLNRVLHFNQPSVGGSSSARIGISIPNSLTQCWHPDRLNKLFALLEEQL